MLKPVFLINELEFENCEPPLFDTSLELGSDCCLAANAWKCEYPFPPRLSLMVFVVLVEAGLSPWSTIALS